MKSSRIPGDPRQRGTRKAGRRAVAFFLGGVSAGGFAVYGFVSGKRRRRQARDRSLALARRRSRRLGRPFRGAWVRARGRTRGLVHAISLGPTPELDDAELVHKVESVVFRDPRMPKGRVSLNAERGRVFLRGEVDDPDLIAALEAAVRRVRGVKDVKNLLHLPGTPAPTSSAGAALRERGRD
jgi:osmotically-inducible protein OsmY